MYVKQFPEEESAPRRNYISQAQPTYLSVCKYVFLAFGWPCLLLLVFLVSCLWLALFLAFGWTSGLPGRKTRMNPRRNLTPSQAQPACPAVCRYVFLAFGPHLGYQGLPYSRRVTLDILQPGFSVWSPPAKQGPADIEGEI